MKSKKLWTAIALGLVAGIVAGVEYYFGIDLSALLPMIGG